MRTRQISNRLPAFRVMSTIKRIWIKSIRGKLVMCMKALLVTSVIRAEIDDHAICVFDMEFIIDR